MFRLIIFFRNLIWFIIKMFKTKYISFLRVDRSDLINYEVSRTRLYLIDESSKDSLYITQRSIDIFTIKV